MHTVIEVMVQQDSTGGNGWVEFYNSSYSSTAVEQMFITTLSREEIQNVFDKNKGNKKKPKQILVELCEAQPMDIYEIPRGDERHTKIAPRTHFVMEADGDPKSGTFHMPFTFTQGKDNYIALYDVNGDLVDDVTIPASLNYGETYAIKAEGRLPSVLDDGQTEWTVKDGQTIETAITKGNYNIREVNENIEAFHIKDPHGYWIALLAMSVVFCALALLYILFKLSADRGQEAVSCCSRCLEGCCHSRHRRPRWREDGCYLLRIVSAPECPRQRERCFDTRSA